MEVGIANHTIEARNYTMATDIIDKKTIFVAYLLVSMVMIFSDALVIATFMKIKIPLTITHKVILHLSVTDCTTGLIMASTFILRRIITALNLDIGFGHATCLLNIGGILSLATTSMMFTAFANFERFMSICKVPFYHRVITRKRVIAMMFLFWILSVLHIVIALSLHTTTTASTTRLERCEYENIFPSWFYISFSSIMIVLMGISLSLYIAILRKAREFYSRFNQSQNQPNTETDAQQENIRRSIRRAKMIGYITLALLVCSAPFSILSLSIGLRMAGNFDIVRRAFTFLAMFSKGILNPFVYAWQLPEIRLGAKRLFSCLICRSNVNDTQEINTIQVTGPTRGGDDNMEREADEEPERNNQVTTELNSGTNTPLPDRHIFVVQESSERIDTVACTSSYRLYKSYIQI